MSFKADEVEKLVALTQDFINYIQVLHYEGKIDEDQYMELLARKKEFLLKQQRVKVIS